MAPSIDYHDMKRMKLGNIKRNLAMTVLAALLVVPILAGTSLISGCAHSVDYQALHDTSVMVHHDTIPGPAFVRFLSILNNSPASPIILLRTVASQSADLFTDVNPQMRKQFVPILHDSTLVLYATYFIDATTQKVDSVTIPGLKPYSLTTVVLFKTTDANDPNRMFPIFANDSARLLIAPKDSCYVRLINGLPDYPQPSPSVNLHIDDINAASYFRDPVTHQSSPVNFQEIRNYVLMPAGTHQIYVRSETDNTQSYTTVENFVSRVFYTIRLTGSKANGTDQLSIDAE